jgi:hypothetical protein
MNDAPRVTDNAPAGRFELTLNGEIAELTYRRRAGRLVLVHTEVPAALGGRGIGGQLVQAAIDRAAADGLTIVPVCPFARSWLERHPEAVASVPVDWAS